MVRRFSTELDSSDAMERAVGGAYAEVGAQQAELLMSLGLRDGQYLVDVGCGAGRTAFALRHLGGLRYLGTDVVPELLAYAQAKVDRSDWRFQLVEGLSVPEAPDVAQFAIMFSVLTHLTPREGRAYLGDVARVVQPGGTIVASFLDSAWREHRRAHGGWLRQAYGRVIGTMVKNVFLSRGQIARWARDLDLRAEFFGPERLGQSYVVMTKPVR
jgi:ubiquinone/menaquinone biosynthesis C-methylase UbiE